MKISSRLFGAFFAAFFYIEEVKAVGDTQSQTSLSDLDGQAFGSRTQRQTINHFTEYAVDNKLAVGGFFNGGYVRSQREDKGETQSSFYLNSAEFFVRYKIYGAGKFGLTMHHSYKPELLSIYNENKFQALMPRQDDYELRFLFAYNMKDRLINQVIGNLSPYFMRAEIAYRHKFSNPFDQMRFNLLTGIKLNQNFSFLLQNSIDWNVNAKATADNNSYSNFTNFQLSKNATNMMTLSLMYHQSPSIAWQFGFTDRLSGNNPFYDKRGLTLGLWSSF